MVTFKFPIRRSDFIYKSVAWVINTVIVIIWITLSDNRQPFLNVHDFILFCHAIAGSTVVLSAFMIWLICGNEDEMPSTLISFLFGVPGSILYVVTGLATLRSTIKLNLSMASYAISVLCIFNSIILIIDVCILCSTD